MHFHVLESIVGSLPHVLGGVDAMRYPTLQPAFDTTDDAISAVMSSAFEHWGSQAEQHVEHALTRALVTIDEYKFNGAVATWTHQGAEGAMWSLKACECTDGCLAQFFNDLG